MARRGIICQACGVEAPAKYVEFYQNIGALVVRFNKSIKGDLCKRCIHKHFWEMTLTNVTLGWWGTVSFILTPFLTINNVARYLGALGLPGTPRDARAPVLTEDAVARMRPHTDELIRRLNGDEDLVTVAGDVAPRAGVSPGQVVRYVVALLEHQQHQAALEAQAQGYAYGQQPTYGFPVVQQPQAEAQPPQQVYAA